MKKELPPVPPVPPEPEQSIPPEQDIPLGDYQDILDTDQRPPPGQDEWSSFVPPPGEQDFSLDQDGGR